MSLDLTTKQLAINACSASISYSWNTAQLYLYKPKSEGLVKGKKVGRQNQWMLTEKGRKTIKESSDSKLGRR